jgi:hypothetical protein
MPQSSRSNEYGTPPHIIQMAREVLGQIDLDPATSENFNQIVQAAKFYTENDFGLLQHWGGKVFLNPPGGTGGVQQKWFAKLKHHVDAGDVEAAVFVGFNISLLRTSQHLLGGCSICVPKDRLKFLITTEELWDKSQNKGTKVISAAARYIDSCRKNGQLIRLSDTTELVPAPSPMYDNVIIGLGDVPKFDSVFSKIGQLYKTRSTAKIT